MSTGAMRKLSEIGKAFTKRRTDSSEYPTEERFSQSSSDEHKSRDSVEIPRPATPQTPERRGAGIVLACKSSEKGPPPRHSSPEPVGRTSLSEASPGRGLARLSLTNDLQGLPSHELDDSESRSKFRPGIALKRLSLKGLARSTHSKSDHKVADKRVINWISSFSQFAPFAPRFSFTTWDQLLGYTADDLSRLGLPMHAVVPLAKIIAVVAEESAMEKSMEAQKEATSLPYALLQLPDNRPRSFSYNNRAIATSENVKTLGELFQELDTEGRGYINESELSVALQRYGVVDQEGAKAWFADIDNNQRGIIDEQQFVDFMAYAYPLIFQQVPNPLWSPRSGGAQQEPPTIFLGGSCNPTSWRRDIVIPLLQKASISYFNPQVDEWYEGLIAIEARAKASATLLFFVIDSLTLSLATMIECTELIISGRPVVLVINDLPADAKLANGEPVPQQVLRDANRARAYMADVAVRHRIQPYSSISRAVCELIQFLHGGWTGGGYEARPRSTLARKSEESWTNLKQKVQAAIQKMNAGRRGSLRGPFAEPAALSLPPPRSPERTQSLPKSALAECGPSGSSDLPLFSSLPSSSLSHNPNSPPVSPNKVPVNVLGNFPHLGGSPPLRPMTHHRAGSLSNMSIASPSSLTIGAARSATSDPRLPTEGDKKGHQTKTSSISSLADIAEGSKPEDFSDNRAPSMMDSAVPLNGVTRTNSSSAADSPRSNASDVMESPVTTPLGSTPTSFLSLSPTFSGSSLP